MSFWDSTFLGAHVWLWFCLLLTILAVSGALAYYFREKVIEKYLKFRWPEKCIEVCIHFPGIARYNSYWRLIPSNSRFDIDNKIYRYDHDKQVWENSELLAHEDNGLYMTHINGVWRKLNTDFLVRRKGWKWPQLHYPYDSPEPMDFSKYTPEQGFVLSGEKLSQIVKTDLWNKALDLSGQNAILLIIVIMGVFNLLIGLFTLAKIMGWIKQ